MVKPFKKIKKAKRQKRGAFFIKYFIILAITIVIGFIITGLALMTFVGKFSSDETLKALTTDAESVSDSTEKLFCSDLSLHNPEATALLFYRDLKTTADASGHTFFMCNTSGEVIACSDAIDNSFVITKEPVCDMHESYRISQSFLGKSDGNTFSGYTTLGGIYEETHAVSISPININEKIVGYTIAASPLSGEITTYFIKLLTAFLVAAVFSLIILTVALFFLADKMSKPIRDLARAARCYSTGDFSYKVPEPNEENEMSELIVEFNLMADSLATLEKSRKNFVANISHEFKTPMTTIGGFINGILDGTIPPEKQSYYLEIVSSEVKRLSNMVNAMLNISRIETGSTNLTIEHFDISKKLLNTLLGFEQLITEKNIDVRGLDNLPNIIIPGDSSMIDQVIYNLFDNAVKFTDKNGYISVDASEDSSYAYFSITNSGKGIPKEHIRNVFERFYKVDESRSTDTKSTGLGLHLVKSITELHGGKVTVKSEENKYTTFTVKLPK